MTQLRLMNQLDMSTKFGDFNTTIMKGDPNINIDYEINPTPLLFFIEINLQERTQRKIHIRTWTSSQIFAGLSDLRTTPMMR
jgi:hypothetical protein